MNEPAILFEDNNVVVLAKPANMAVHATTADDDTGTLVEWLSERYPALREAFPKPVGDIWRPGIAHRLDKDTSGVMVVAKTLTALNILQDQFRNRTTQKLYRAIVSGETGESGEFSGFISRSDADPTRQQTRRMSFSWSKGTPKEAETKYQRLGFNQERGVSLVELIPKTGRMHQLRVQLADAGWPILGDERYGTKLSQQISENAGISRQMLHAKQLTFTNPSTDQEQTFTAPYPADFIRALEALSLPLEA